MSVDDVGVSYLLLSSAKLCLKKRILMARRRITVGSEAASE